MRFPSRLVNLRGELFSSTFTYGMTAVIRLGSSLVLTRLLSPEAYGIFGILLSFMFMIELMSDVGTVGLLVRHPRGNENAFIHTVWTVRLIRSVFNFCLVFFGAPIIAAIYHTPILSSAFRVLSFWFLFFGLESMSFVLAQRDQKARISNYAEMIASAVTTVFVIVVASKYKSQFALIYGLLLQRALLMAGSYFFYRNVGVKIAFEREAMAEQFRFARYVLPSSLLTIVLSQYDKVVLLKLFDLATLGFYGIAQNMIGPIGGVIMHNARVILYARCSEYFRTDKATAAARYYAENTRLLLVGVIPPALVAGFSQLMVAILYDARYAMVGDVLMVLALATMVAAFQYASENFLVASGRTQMVLLSNVVRLCGVIPASFLGYYFYGFYGFLWFNFLAACLVMLYLFREQRKHGLLNLRNELGRLGIGVAVFLVALAASQLALAIIPPNWLHLGLKRH